jgi:hypothetical protein
MRISGMVILLIGAGFLVFNVGASVYFMALTGGWSLGGFAHGLLIDLLAITCIVAGALILRQSRRPAS